MARTVKRMATVVTYSDGSLECNGIMFEKGRNRVLYFASCREGGSRLSDFSRITNYKNWKKFLKLGKKLRFPSTLIDLAFGVDKFKALIDMCNTFLDKQ